MIKHDETAKTANREYCRLKHGTLREGGFCVDKLLDVGYNRKTLKTWEASVLKLLFKTGFPQLYMGQYKLYVFEIILNDGTIHQAVADQTACDDKLCWKDLKTRVIIPETTVLGWRETYNCDAARQDIDAYFRRPASIVSKDHLGDAFARHIDGEPCPNCREYYKEKSKPAVSTAAG